MGNTGLLRHDAEMTLLQPTVRGDETPRTQEFALLACLVVQVSISQGGRKKALLKMLMVLDPIKTSPFVVPTIRKEAPTGNTPMGATPLKAVTNRFPQVGGNQISEAPRVVFDPTLRDEGSQSSNQSFSSGRGKPNFRGSKGRFRPHSRG